jgi:hypothetical protein
MTDNAMEKGFRCYKCHEQYERIGEHMCPPKPKPIGPRRWSDIWTNPDACIGNGVNAPND